MSPERLKAEAVVIVEGRMCAIDRRDGFDFPDEHSKHLRTANGMGPSIYLRDPEGNVIELKQMPAADRKPQ